MATSKQPTLHHLESSQSQRVVWLLEELAIPYTLVTHIRDPVTHRAPPSLVAATPLGKAPTLFTADGEPIIETSAIMAYLIKTYDHSRKFQGATLTSHDPFIRDEILTSFCSASLHPFMLLKVFISSGFLTDNTHGQLIEPRIAGALAYLEDQLGEQEYFMGKEPGRPDFMISLPIDGIVQRGGEGLLGPRMKAWRERVLEREGWKKALEKPGVPYDLTFGKK